MLVRIPMSCMHSVASINDRIQEDFELVNSISAIIILLILKQKSQWEFFEFRLIYCKYHMLFLKNLLAVNHRIFLTSNRFISSIYN